MKNIIWGIIVIAIGIFNGGSVFTGNPTGIDYLFDGAGIILIVFGLFQLIRGRGASKAVASKAEPVRL